MLLFYQWASTQDFGFMLKTDDDCYVNVNGILTFLKSIELFNISNLWIGNFRENFAIDRHGKWAEHDFQAVSYPPFACGSGYLLSKDLVEWIALNHGRLNFYQGEDTSLGIWLTSIYPNRIQDERFKCARTCEENLFSLPENNIKQLEYFYSNGHNSFSCNETIN
uniref:Hexosyltransferase n=2 Tax=Clytia hemisphaerica TaxID=252671 RepID=A0A7M5WX39_9CNID|eukprot:TCONS_00031524-protein